jgi:hypothetical protein
MASIPTCCDLPVSGIRRRVESGEPRSKSRAGELSANGHGCRNFEGAPCVALWQQPGGGRLADSRNRPIAAGYSATNYFLGALGRRCRKRTPGPPPFSSMNSTPAASKARRTAKSLAAVIEVSSSASSARRMVATLKSDCRARSSALQRRRERAALIWALLSGLAILTHTNAYAMINIILDDVRHKPCSVSNAIFNQGGRHEIAGVDKLTWWSALIHRRLGRPGHYGNRRGRPGSLMARETGRS